MSTVEVKTYRHKCDRCGAKKINHDSGPPNGWEIIPSHGWGMTGYTKDELCCPECVASLRQSEEKP